jgi:formate hydrogenlyase subunit 3/multisubunit Na+/H+ antiporter MnhD subunit
MLLAGALYSLFRVRSAEDAAGIRLITAPASLFACCVACAALWTGARESLALPLSLPLGECRFALDPLRSAFLIPTFLLAAVASLVLPGRLAAMDEGVDYGRHGFFFCLLAAGMALVVQAADGPLFLILWEIMSLAPFFLLVHNGKREKRLPEPATDPHEDGEDGHGSQSASDAGFAGRIYLIAAHLGALFLLLAFACWETGAAGGPETWTPARTRLIFVAALIGFGAKCGLFPLHVWMPEAHAAAPGHVAVLMSGAMLNMGVYGLMTTLRLLGLDGGLTGGLDSGFDSGPGDPLYAYVLMGTGALSGLFGILAASAQSDMKRVLAYSSAENMGIILIALGACLLALQHDALQAALLAAAGALLHVWNHSLCKSLLFLTANAVKESVHTTLIPRLGGLQKRLPFTGACFAAGSAAIAGLPPLNCFLSELLIYLGLASGAYATRGTEAALVFMAAFFVLGSISGMSLFTFTRLFGLTFLGLPRSGDSAHAREPDAALRAAAALQALLCVVAGLAAPLMFRLVRPALLFFTGDHAPQAADALAFIEELLPLYSCAALPALAVFAAVRIANARAGRASRECGTWACAYPYGNARMQYSAASFALGLVLFLKPMLRPRITVPAIRALFPGAAEAGFSAPDRPTELWIKILFRPVAYAANKAKALQHGLLNIYILYILVALTAALVWALGVTS